MDINTLETIYKHFENDEARKAVELINQDVLYDFWHDYRTYLDRLFIQKKDALFTFSEHVITYFRVMNR